MKGVTIFLASGFEDMEALATRDVRRDHARTFAGSLLRDKIIRHKLV